ncbi:MAG: hypothetical protein CME74_06805, partial [Halomonas sp.]|nr:hypothetical protein [Halomonas sp.]
MQAFTIILAGVCRVASQFSGAVHSHLGRLALRPNANIVVETGYARDAHQMAVLFGVGATAVYPWLAYQ